MNSITSCCKTWLVAASLAAFTLVAQASDLGMAPKHDLLAVAKQRGNFTVLERAIEAAGLQQTLAAAGPMTLFAPTDGAFAKLPAAALEALLKPENKDQLIKILSYHVIAGKALEQDQLKHTRSAMTVEGEPIEFALVNGRLRVAQSRVLNDYRASNGVLIAVDAVLMPR